MPAERTRLHMHARSVATLFAASVIASITLIGCKREERSFRVLPPSVATIDAVPTTDFHAGGYPATQPAGNPQLPQITNDYEENAQALNDGKRLFDGYNCSGCHFHGGGGIGPPLMDDTWIYGSNPDQVFATIVQGRPNGMPSFRAKIPDHQVWEIVAYVRSMSGLTSSQAAPNREDQMHMTPPENSEKTKSPVNSAPKS